MKKLFFLLIYILFSCPSYCQQAESLITQISGSYKNFEYEKVISLSESLITNSTHLSQSILTELFRLKALSHYSLGEEIAAQICFISILEMSPDFKLDPLENSPKIIHFFNRLKDQYIEQQQQVAELIEQPEPADSVVVQSEERSLISRSAFLRSILLPGWGHLYVKKKSKALIFGTLAIAAAISSIYYSIRTHDKEKDYLNEIILAKIEDRYKSYNKAYKLRNILISSYVLIWLYSQFDLLLNENNKVNSKSGVISFIPSYHSPNQFGLNISIQF